VCIYEAIVAITFLCHDQYEKKVGYIFSIFDFDQSFELKREEFELTITVACRALAKVLKVSTPSASDIESLANSCFLKVDCNMNNSVSVEELIEFFKTHYEIQNFLLQYTNSTSHENAQKRFEEKFESAKAAFEAY